MEVTLSSEMNGSLLADHLSQLRDCFAG